MNLDLVRKNKNIRKDRPITPTNKLYSTYLNNGVLQICFRSRGCSNSLSGFCIMCDYGVGTNITKDEIEKSFDMAISENNNVRTLLLNSYGSILDTSEIDEESFYRLLIKIKNSSIKRIIFETHYTTITEEKLTLIKKELKDKIVSFELGFETSNERIREENLLKIIDNNKFIQTINLIHKFDMRVLVNILVGIPFLKTKEQLEDTLNSIFWCIKNDVDEIELFPINVKPYTLLNELYESKQYDVISHWLLIEVLNRIPLEYLSKIYLAWYGNRELEYENQKHSIFPKSCPNCNNNLMEFYSNFLSNDNAQYRKELINTLISKSNCDCYNKVLKKL